MTAASLPARFADIVYSSGPGSGWTLLVLIGPAFIISPGLIQKSYGARERARAAHRRCDQRVALMVFAFVPVLFGMMAEERWLPGIDGSRPRPANRPDARAAAVARRDRARRRVLDRSRYL